MFAICEFGTAKTFYLGLCGLWDGFYPIGSHGAGALPIALDVIRHDNVTFYEINCAGHDFKYAWTDTECNPSVGIPRVVDLFYGLGPLQKPIDVLIGPACSIVCESIGFIARETNTPMVSFNCYSNLLSNKSIYPTLARTKGPSRLFAPTFISLMKFVSGSESFFVSTTNAIRKELASYGILVTDFRTLPGFSTGDTSNSMLDLSTIRERCKDK